MYKLQVNNCHIEAWSTKHGGGTSRTALIIVGGWKEGKEREEEGGREEGRRERREEGGKEGGKEEGMKEGMKGGKEGGKKDTSYKVSHYDHDPHLRAVEHLELSDQ